MGFLKREKERLDGIREKAIEAGVLAKELEVCEEHGTVIRKGDGQNDGKAYAIGTKWCQKGEIDGTVKEFRDAMKDVFEDAADECYIPGHIDDSEDEDD